jgi:hypothetical protein
MIQYGFNLISLAINTDDLESKRTLLETLINNGNEINTTPKDIEEAIKLLEATQSNQQNLNTLHS